MILLDLPQAWTRVLARALELARVLELELELARALARVLARALELELELELARALARVLARALARALELARVLARALELELARALELELVLELVLVLVLKLVHVVWAKVSAWVLSLKMIASSSLVTSKADKVVVQLNVALDAAMNHRVMHICAQMRRRQCVTWRATLVHFSSTRVVVMLRTALYSPNLSTVVKLVAA